MPATRIVLAPGASGSIEQLAPHAAGLERLGYRVERIALPTGKAERAVPAFAAAAGAEAALAVIGGQSYGGRVASLLAAEQAPAALVCFAYPLHAPGRHDAWVERTSHWPRIACPVLLVSGESDPFARIDLLREAMKQLPNGRLVTYPGVGHGVKPVLAAALGEVDDFIRANT
ncbi:MAG TPA: alpha/beta family hydrolase [Candidatus Limnocylindria bacterium]|nr:alpha/beta family hydrolase [Candidatus Limnocylindria bacterium]